MRKHLIEKVFEGELDAHLGYRRYERNDGSTSRNGKAQKTVKTEKRLLTIDVPRDRDGSFEPQLVRKGQARSGILDRQIIALYSKGMTTREITATIKEMYDVDVSPTLVSHVTDHVIDEVRQWHGRPLFSDYPSGKTEGSEKSIFRSLLQQPEIPRFVLGIFASDFMKK